MPEDNETDTQPTEVQSGPSVSDLVLASIEQRPLEFQQSFHDLMQQRIEDAVAEKKLEVASIFTDPEKSQYEPGEDEGPEKEEPEIEDEGEVEAEEEE